MSSRVLMLSTDAAAGGIQTALALYAEALDLIGWTYRLAVPQGAPLAKERADDPRIETYSPLAWWRFRCGLGGKVAKALQSADIVITHNNRLIGPAARQNVPVLAIAHGDKRRHLERATKIVALSRAFADRLASDGIVRERLCLLSHALPPAVREPVDQAARDGPVLVLAAGRFVEKKGFGDWLDAVAPLASGSGAARFLLAGDGETRQALERRAAALGARVEFLGWQPTRSLMAQADVFCLPSRDEPFGLVLLEAMAAGLACVATRTNGPLDLIDDGSDGLLVPVGEPAAMTAALRRLIDSAALRADLGATARAKALGPLFTPERFAKGLEQALLATRAASIR